MILENIEKQRELQKARIRGIFKEATEEKGASIIAKSEFEAQYPDAQYERYSVQSLTKFRDELNKSEDVEDKDAAFKEATKDFKHFLVVEKGQKVPMFVRKKISGE